MLEKKKESTRIRLAVINLSESEIDILKEDISPNAETKATLLYTECGHIDHGTEIVQEWISLAKKREEIYNENKEPEVEKRKEDIYSSIWASKSKLSQGRPRLNSKERLYEKKRNLELYITIWDLPFSANTARVRRCLNQYGKTEVKEWCNLKNSKAAYVKIVCRNEEQKRNLQNAWAIHFEEGKTSRFTPDRFDAEKLKDRKEYRLVLKNIPNSAPEAVLLRQLRRFKAKMVFILKNRNNNPRGNAIVYFASLEDLLIAKESTPYYFHNRLE